MSKTLVTRRSSFMPKKRSIRVANTINTLNTGNTTTMPTDTPTPPQPAWIETKSILSKKQRRRRRSIIREFALNTSTHGLPGIARSDSKHNRIFWTISFFIFMGIMIFFIFRTIAAYFQFSTQTSVSIVVEQNQLFPAVTVCNFSPVRSDRLIEPFFNYTDANNITQPNQSRIITPLLANILRQYLLKKVNVGESIRENFFTLDMMMISCTYNNITCSINDFIAFESADHGLCYTFNARRKNSTNYTIRQVLQDGGPGLLKLQLYAHSHLYVPFAADDVSGGMVAMIHDNTDLPLIDVAGIHLTPGFKHKLGYKKRTNYFLPAPYTDCTNKIPAAMQAMFNRYAGADYVYSQDVCYLICQQTFIYHECGCVNPHRWPVRTVTQQDSDDVIIAPLCDVNSKCYMNATYHLSNDENIWKKFCSQCTQACWTVDFLVTPSAASAPALPYAYEAMQFVVATGVQLPTNWPMNWISEVKNNYVSLEVICQSTLVENYTQEASISAVDVLSNVGGHTGLWIGISFLSLMEFVEMVYRLVRLEIHTIINKIKGSA